MLIPPPFPDEIAIGYAGRVARLNSCTSALVRHILEGWWGRGAVRLGATAPIFASEPLAFQRFVRDHTLVPLALAIRRRPPVVIAQKVIESSVSNAQIWRVGKYPKWCAECAIEDRRRLGSSPWRRSHNLPGIDWCMRHGTVLRMGLSKDAFDRSVGGGRERDTTGFAAATNAGHRRVLNRYADVVTSLLNSDLPIALENLLQTLSRRTRMRRIGFEPIAGMCSFVDYALTKCPEIWLQEHFGVHRVEPTARPRSVSLESLLRSERQVETHVYALALALLL